ncbi:Alpha-(1 3)-fucosyltransferase 11 [Mactra antiquata]
MAQTKVTTTVGPFKIFLYLSLVSFLTLMIVGYSMLSNDHYEDLDDKMPDFTDVHEDDHQALREDITHPIILWWTPFTGEAGASRSCGDNACFFTIDKHYYHHPQSKVMMFYGSDINKKNLPIPRLPRHEWALMHEESPKNDYTLTNPTFLSLFNHTATFKRESDFPLTLQYLDSIPWVESTKFLVTTPEKTKLQEELAPVFYAQSDCHTPSDRDAYVEEFMKYMKVDSYGFCLHNKELPKHLADPIPGMDHEDFFSLQAKYKFSFAMENAVCDDYITEKFWRPLHIGSVPIIYGSPKIRDFLPDEHSAILVTDFESPKQLAEYLKYLNENDEEYNKYLEWKHTGVTNKYLLDLMEERTWSITETWKTGASNFIEDFECFVCNRLHENLRRRKEGKKEIEHIVDKSHLECPVPKPFFTDEFDWDHVHEFSDNYASAVKYFAQQNVAYSKGEYNAKLSEIISSKQKGWF